MRISAVILDLDGTLLDTLADIADSANRILAGQGVPTLPRDAYRTLVGEGVVRLFERALPDPVCSAEMIRRCSELFREDYAHSWNISTRPYDDVDRLLQEVADREIKMSVLSNKPHEFTTGCVQEYFGTGWFELVLGQSDEVPAKPDPTGTRRIIDELGVPAQEFLMLGDTGTDMRTALAAGVYPVGALWGFRTRDELVQGGARQLIAHPLDLIPILDGKA
jgi:phosphoglycolate phosphatase